MSLPDDDVMAAIAEVLRCARGVMRTADPQKISDGVVTGWWDALGTALATMDRLGEAVKP